MLSTSCASSHLLIPKISFSLLSVAPALTPMLISWTFWGVPAVPVPRHLHSHTQLEKVLLPNGPQQAKCGGGQQSRRAALKQAVRSWFTNTRFPCSFCGVILMRLFCTLLVGASACISYSGSGFKGTPSPPLPSLQHISLSTLVFHMFPFKLHSMLCLRVCSWENREGDVVIIPVLLLRTLKLREFHKLHMVT